MGRGFNVNENVSAIVGIVLVVILLIIIIAFECLINARTEI